LTSLTFYVAAGLVLDLESGCAQLKVGSWLDLSLIINLTLKIFALVNV